MSTPLSGMMAQLHRLTAEELETLACAAWHLRHVVDSPVREDADGSDDSVSSATLGGNGHGGWVELR